MILRIAFLLLLFSSQALAVPSRPEVKTYDKLLHAIREVQHATQQRIEAAVESEKVREAWEIGKLIDTHVLQHKERADYGAYVIKKLSEDLGIDRTELYRMLEFARVYPIVGPAQQLSWSHYSSLLALNDPEEIKELAEKAEKEKWTRDQVREEVHRRKPSMSSSNGFDGNPGLPEIKPGKVGIYRIVRAIAGPYKGDLVLDLGFSNYFRFGNKRKFKEGDLVFAGKDRISGDESILYTYNAYLLQVVDGDTFHAVIDLGFGITLEQRLRLRRLDAPEIVSADGKKAKEVLEKILRRNQGRMILKTSKADDQYGRYLADVFLPARHSHEGGNLENYVSIDQELLDSGWFTLRGNE